jgi:hypothetical protein
MYIVTSESCFDLQKLSVWFRELHFLLCWHNSDVFILLHLEKFRSEIGIIFFQWHYVITFMYEMYFCNSFNKLMHPQ